MRIVLDLGEGEETALVGLLRSNRGDLKSRQEPGRLRGGQTRTGSCFPPGRFIALDDGQIIADAATFDGFDGSLAVLGKDRPDVFVVQAGASYPDEVFILL